MSVPFFTVREDDSRGAKHGQTQWEEKIPWWKEDETYRASHTARGWTEEYRRYLDYLAPIDISYVATWKARPRYENMLVLTLNDGKH